jgi:competence ComEA-like helix-hairpin-helix protein
MWRIGLFWIICHLAVAAPLVDINAASAQEIAEGLVGIGVKKAQAIVAYWIRWGRYPPVKSSG